MLYHAGRLCSVFQERPKELRIDKKNAITLRFSALMHDTGHGPFSHTSEQFYSALPEFREISSVEPTYADSSASEILSSKIVISKPFRAFVAAINSHFNQELDCDTISQCITGSLASDRMFLSEIVHGPFDADKLDYMHRDSMYSGLKMHVDLDRLFASINIKQATVDGRLMVRLCGSVSGITPLTQIMFNKMILFTGMYHHHKVRVVDCMLWAIFDLAVRNKAEVGGVKIVTPADFLRLTDDYVLMPGLTNDEEIKQLILRIRKRDLWERALVISRRTVPESMHADAKGDRRGLFNEYTKLMGNSPEKIKARRKVSDTIWKKAGKPCNRYEVWLDIPHTAADGRGEADVDCGPSTGSAGDARKVLTNFTVGRTIRPPQVAIARLLPKRAQKKDRRCRRRSIEGALRPQAASLSKAVRPNPRVGVSLPDGSRLLRDQIPSLVNPNAINFLGDYILDAKASI